MNEKDKGSLRTTATLKINKWVDQINVNVAKVMDEGEYDIDDIRNQIDSDARMIAEVLFVHHHYVINDAPLTDEALSLKLDSRERAV